MEKWLPVVGYEGLYEVSDQGQVRSLDRQVTEKNGKTRLSRGRVLKPATEVVSGRRSVGLRPFTDRPTRRVYELVLEAFVGPRQPGMSACHGDGNASNDALSNLRWGTYSENAHDTINHGHNVQSNKTHCSRGHEFIPDNLHRAQSARGGRSCLACHRAAANVRAARSRGVAFDLQQVSDQHFRLILAGKPRRRYGPE